MSIYGWIDKTGQFHECNVLGHSRLLETIPGGKAVIEAVEQEIKHEIQWCLERKERGEHPEWHNVDLLEGDYLHNLYEGAYEAGFLRVGSVGSELHFEGRRKVFTEKYPICKELADYHDRRCVFEPRESG